MKKQVKLFRSDSGNHVLDDDEILKQVQALSMFDQAASAPAPAPALVPAPAPVPVSAPAAAPAPAPTLEEKDEYQCPISFELMTDPVIAEDGHSYERSAIEDWFGRGSLTSPKTGEPIGTNLFPNHNLRKLIEEYQEAIAKQQAGGGAGAGVGATTATA